MNDRGLYSCNLHHHYCHLYEVVRVQLNVTKSRTYRIVCTYCTWWLYLTQLMFFLTTCFKGRKEQRYWDGQKAVYVVLLGSTVVLPCINRRKVWTDWSEEEEDQQVRAAVMSLFVCPLQTISLKSRLTLKQE